MVVGFVLEKYKPVLCLRAFSIVNFNRHNNCAGIVFLGLLHICKLAVLLELLHAHESDIHKGNEFLFFLVISCIKSISCCKVLVIGLLYRLLVEAIAKLDFFELCTKSSVTAVVRPVCIKHSDLSH